MGSRRDYDDRRFYGETTPLPVRTREREYEERAGYNRPSFLDDDYNRVSTAGPMVLREREQETVLRQRPRSLSPIRYEERRFVERSPTPPSDYTRTRVVERERERRRSPSPQLRARVVETRERIRERTPSPPPVRIQERYVERRRERTPSPVVADRVRIRNIEQREVVKVPTPEPIRPPSPIRAPPIHQEVITHHRHIDHGFERARVPTPPPPVRQSRLKETDIDIYTSRNNTEVDITRRTSDVRSRTPAPPAREQYSATTVRRERDDSYLYEQERDRLRVSDTRLDLTRRRSLSARPPPVRERSRERVRVDIRDSESEADYYARKTNERAYIGEAYNGATKDWTIVDVPPGTERVRMDGVGGGSQEISWQKYNGVRRSKFIPERDSISSVSSSSVRDRVEITDRQLVSAPPATSERTTLEIDISSRRRAPAREYEREYERIEERDDRRIGPPRTQKIQQDLWTEITKDLVTREAIQELGYDFEETEFFFYIIQYLRYEDVLELVQLTETIRRERSYRAREIEWERRDLERHDRRYFDNGTQRVWDRTGPFDDERVTEREVIYSSTGGGRKSGGRRW